MFSLKREDIGIIVRVVLGIGRIIFGGGVRSSMFEGERVIVRMVFFLRCLV